MVPSFKEFVELFLSVKEYELYTEEKLPKGWRKQIPGHCEPTPRNGNGKKSYTYVSWYNRILACYVASQQERPQSRHYKENGTKMCVRWVVGDGIKCGFLCFLEDMGERPLGMTIDRINPFGHYTPDNCRWADAKTQAANKRKSKKRAA